MMSGNVSDDDYCHLLPLSASVHVSWNLCDLSDLMVVGIGGTAGNSPQHPLRLSFVHVSLSFPPIWTWLIYRRRVLGLSVLSAVGSDAGDKLRWRPRSGC